ncbi:MarR family winged helix-turn-helix transcriptional regulator [Paeniglutamicibacter gangotriensis]|uniref:MarR family winged helix-turn-helix transcriptional regulator n=1 Tax=Paeniglutamicibacter gangotriensis TaxID=254787 RepID=UPI001F3530D3|nr:MarR family transcriptional regulator [Paeniglutamicibacter gangotriensis]
MGRTNTALHPGAVAVRKTLRCLFTEATVVTWEDRLRHLDRRGVRPLENEELPTIYNLDSSDPRSELIDRSGVDESALKQIDRIMSEMGRLRAVERKISRASQQFMKLNETDMRAVRLLISAKNTGSSVTPSMLAKHLKISTASVTKMIDKMEKAGHVLRTVNPADRRSLCVQVTNETHSAARDHVGRHHAARFGAAVRLSDSERETVIRFLAETAFDLETSIDDMADRKTPDLP